MDKSDKDLWPEANFYQDKFIKMLGQLNINDPDLITSLKKEPLFSYDDHVLTHCGACARYICNDFKQRFEKIKGISYSSKDLYENIWELYDFIQYIAELKLFLKRNYRELESINWSTSKDFNKTIYNFLLTYKNVFEPQAGLSNSNAEHKDDISRLNQYGYRYCNDILHDILQLPCFNASDQGLDFNNSSLFNKDTNPRFEKLLSDY